MKFGAVVRWSAMQPIEIILMVVDRNTMVVLIDDDDSASSRWLPGELKDSSRMDISEFDVIEEL